MVHLVFMFSVMLVKPFQGPESKISFPNLVHSSGRIIFPMALRDGIRDSWISTLMIFLLVWEKHVVKTVLFGIRFNSWVLWCPLQPCTENSYCPPHNPSHSLHSHLHCLQMWKTMTLNIFLNLSTRNLNP